MHFEKGERYRLKPNVIPGASYAIFVYFHENKWTTGTYLSSVNISDSDYDLIFIEEVVLHLPQKSITALIFELGFISVGILPKEASNFEEIRDTTKIDHSGQIYNPFTNTWSWF